MLLASEIAFSVPVNSFIEFIGGGEPKAGQSSHLDSNRYAVPSICDIY